MGESGVRFKMAAAPGRRAALVNAAFRRQIIVMTRSFKTLVPKRARPKGSAARPASKPVTPQQLDAAAQTQAQAQASQGPAPEASQENGSAEPRPPEIGGPDGPEPTRYGDWERGGICYDF